MKFSFVAFPSLVVPVLAYAFAALTMGDGVMTTLSGEALSFLLPSGSSWSMNWGEVVIAVGLLFLFIDLLKATGTGAATVANHALSMLVFVGCLVLFLMVGTFGTTVFFMLILMALLDVIAGFTITIIAARRDFGVG